MCCYDLQIAQISFARLTIGDWDQFEKVIFRSFEQINWSSSFLADIETFEGSSNASKFRDQKSETYTYIKIDRGRD